MDDSQNSNIFDNSAQFTNENFMDSETYRTLLEKTKTILSLSIAGEVRKPEFSSKFTSLLTDCHTCITQGIDFIKNLVSEVYVELEKITDYLEDVVCILHLLSNYIKNIVESITLSCCSMKSFPVSTGQIIMCVFTHCNDSEAIYGSHLNTIEKQLKDLFRTCHDLQVTYLTILEKHFIFDFSDEEERFILIEALNINLEIGEVVQSLDVKTMADQWKSYILLCEKYACCLNDNKIYQNCIQAICPMIKHNISTAVEAQQDEKITMRSLKVASFTIKILLKIYNVFKQSKLNINDSMMDLLLFINCSSVSYFEASKSANKANDIQQWSSLISNPAESLLHGLLSDNNFINHVLQCDVNNLKYEDRFIGHLLITVSGMKISLSNNLVITKRKLIDLVFSFLPCGNLWFNMGIKCCNPDSTQLLGLYETLLVNTIAFAVTLNAEEFSYLENKMYEALLNTECYGALFSSDLWVFLIRLNGHLLSNLFIHQCRIYQTLENTNLFHSSPQKIHISHTLTRLFQAMPNDERIPVFRQYNVHDDKNVGLWSVLKIKNLPVEIQRNAEEILCKKLKMEIELFAASKFQEKEEFIDLINLMRLASTCSFVNVNKSVEECVVKAWMKICPSNRDIFARNSLNSGIVWYAQYVEALVNMTNAMKIIFERSENIVRVLHVIKNLTKLGNNYLKLLLVDLTYRMYLETLDNDENKNTIDSLLEESFRYLLQDNLVTEKLFTTMNNHDNNSNLDQITQILDEDRLQKWYHFIKHGKSDINDWKEKLKTTDFEFSHKCIKTDWITESETNSIIELSGSENGIEIKKSLSINFDFADENVLFNTESDSEPDRKKLKLTPPETEKILARLEKDVSLIYELKENIISDDFKHRIRNLCDMLGNVLR